MRQLSGSGQKILDAVIGGVGPKYIHVLVPSQTTHTLESSLFESAAETPQQSREQRRFGDVFFLFFPQKFYVVAYPSALVLARNEQLR